MGKASRRRKERKPSYKEAQLQTVRAAEESRSPGIFLNPYGAVVIIVMLGLIAYANSFDVPFHFDDEPVIEKNPIIKDLHYFVAPSEAKKHKDHFEYPSFRMRYVGYLTFALNYRVHGLDVTGYHIVNLLIHIITALLVYLFVTLIFRTPYLARSSIRHYDRHIALLTALLFVVHPIQTQAITYIWQRVASLVTLFYVLTLVLYVKARLLQTTEKKGKGLVFGLYAFSIIAAVLAMKTKENAFTLPFMVTLCEFSFFNAQPQSILGSHTIRRSMYILPFILTLIIIPLSALDKVTATGDIMGALNDASRDPGSISRTDYLFTQFRVIVTYIRLIFLPVHQNLDYSYPIYSSLSNVNVFLSLLLLVMVIGGAVYLFHRSRFGAYGLRLISFGIFWFFIALSVESSVLPIKDVIFEHRLYLPSVGIFILLSSSIYIVVYKLRGRWKTLERNVIATSAVIIVFLTGATYERNNVWRDRVQLWKDVVIKSPEKSRGHYNLGLMYHRTGQNDKAVPHLETAVRLNPESVKAQTNLGNAYNEKGLFDKAIEHYQVALTLEPDDPETYYNLGIAYNMKGLLDDAEEQFLIALTLKPESSEIHNNLGVIYRKKGVMDKAIVHFRKAAALDPDNRKAQKNLTAALKMEELPEGASVDRISAEQKIRNEAEAHFNQGNTYNSQGLLDQAIEEFQAAIELYPDYVSAHNHLGIVYSIKGEHDRAMEQFQTAIRLNPEHAESYNNMGIIYEKKGLTDKAIERYRKALTYNPDLKIAQDNLDRLLKKKR